jgi:type VI secretion system protein ImpH
MGSIARGKFPHLIQDLLKNPSSFDFFQAIHLLETNLGGEAVTGDNPQHYLSIAPAAELSFPAGEIRHCYIDNNDRFRLEVNFMGFYGVDSPLPQFFNDIAAFDIIGSAELRAFLALFNQRLYQLLYSAWKKMNLHASNRFRNSLYCRYLEALYGGSGTCHLLGRFDYAGILGNRVKNSRSLADMLKDFIESPVRVQQNIPCWIELEETADLGGKFALGNNSILGNRLMDVNSKILIHIGPMTIRKATKLLPGRPQAETLAHMIREYLDPTIQYDLVMVIQPGEAYTSTLGGDESILGWTACIGQAGDIENRIILTGESLDQTRRNSPASTHMKTRHQTHRGKI